MKINWFSPLPPAQTEIANCAMRVLEVLQNRAEIVAWTNQLTWSSEIEKYARVCRYQLNQMPWKQINQGDLNIYHIGNNADFHADIWQISRQSPGLVILHDFKLQHFFTGIYNKTWYDKEVYIEHMQKYYGLKGRQAAASFWLGNISIEYMDEHYPLVNLALENSVGAIAHNLNIYKILEREKRWFVGYVPLPYKSQSKSTNKINFDRSLPYRLILFGYLNSNRCLDIVLEALSTFSDKNAFRLDIYGRILNKKYFTSIKEKIKTLGLSDRVKIHGFVEESILDKALANAHLAINLRYPTMEEASASQLRIWSQALPSLVTKIGWYATLPQDTVAFVRHDRFVEDIQQQLQKFLDNPEEFVAMGKRGKRLLEEQHTPEIYAKAIVDFSEKACQFRCKSVGYQLINRLCEQMSDLSNYQFSEQEIKRPAEAIHFLTFRS